ncbi:cytochrome c oxidase assembly protein [Microbacterium sp. X-17]|uniref:cytochrome c oxidase assembly protein n=1 Tax=Microbacterium sp. X-17 TaxID=3144404 RepID=UPI0031F4998D
MTFADLFTAWAPTPWGIGLPALCAAAYLVAVLRLRRRGIRWSRWRSLWWLLACLLAVWTLCGAPWALRTESDWMDGLAVGMAAAVLPLGAALADPVRLAETVRGRPVRFLRGRIARAFMYPGVSSALSALFLTIAMTSRWYSPHGQTPELAWLLLLLGAFVTGMLVNLPLFGEDLLPVWATPGVKTLIAFLDGIFDAIPGIVVMLLVNMKTGGALLATAEVIGIPMIAATLVQWVRADAATTRVIDAELDAEEPGDGLWWQSDPRFQDRY